MNRTETGKFISHDGKSEIFYTTVSPCDMPPHAVLQICHGMTEHIGRYADFAEHLVSHGVAVCMHDHLGHGKSSREEDYGFFGENGGIENLKETGPAGFRRSSIIFWRGAGTPVPPEGGS